MSHSNMFYPNPKGDIIGSGYVERILARQEKLKDISLDSIRNRYGAFMAGAVRDLQESKNLRMTLSKYSGNVQILSVVAGSL